MRAGSGSGTPIDRTVHAGLGRYVSEGARKCKEGQPVRFGDGGARRIRPRRAWKRRTGRAEPMTVLVLRGRVLEARETP